MTIFGGRAATFAYKGEKSLKGRRVVEFTYEVPLEKSQYLVYTAEHHHIRTAYGDEFHADAGTFDLVRLVVQSRGLKPGDGACQDTTTVAFSSDISSASAAAGDRIPCRILNPIGDVVPAGTPLTCRLIRVQHFDLPSPSLTVAFELQDLSVRGLPVRLSAAAGTEGHSLAGAVLNIHRANERTNVAVLEFSKTRRDHTIKSGFKTSWVTVPPR